MEFITTRELSIPTRSVGISVANWVLSELYLNETSLLKCNYVYSKIPLTNKTYRNKLYQKQYQKHNVKIKNIL
jgi:hypothetical protein